MRIISGKLRGRQIKGYDISGTRPTMDRVKESFFAMIQGKIASSIVLDLFAGSGNLGIEALSNGATYCYFVDYNQEACKIIGENIMNCKLTEQSQIMNMHYEKALSLFYKEHLQFDLVFLDPPYHMRIIQDLLQALKNYDLLKQDALVVCETEENTVYGPVSGYELWKSRTYGPKTVQIYRRKGEK